VRSLKELLKLVQVITFIERKKRRRKSSDHGCIIIYAFIRKHNNTLDFCFAFFTVYWISLFLEFPLCATAGLMQIN